MASNDAANDTKIIFYTHSHGLFASEYAYVCDAVAPLSLQWQDSVFGCGLLGADWALATFPTITALNGLRAAITKPVRQTPDAWVGAHLSGIGEWKWTAGRLIQQLLWANGGCPSATLGNTTFSNCPWAPSCPVTTPGADCALLSGDLAMGMGNAACTSKVPCFVCERSPCVVGIDCFSPNTDSVSGHQPKCICACKSGYWGPKCEYPIVVDHGTFISEYWMICDGNHQWASANISCASRGAEWSLATLPTTASIDQYQKGLQTIGEDVQNAWIAATTTPGDLTSWWWRGSRINRQIFWQSTPTVVYKAVEPNALPRTKIVTTNLWGAGTPENSPSDAKCGFISKSQPSRLSDQACDAQLGCYVCERSPCRMGTDCYGPNTASMTPGYYPNCACTCKAGAWGDRCQFPITVNHGPYASDYQYLCNQPGGTMADARSACSAIAGGKWSLASFPSNISLLSFKANVVPSVNLWIGAAEANGNIWSWTDGRLAGRTFFGNPTCGPVNYYLSDIFLNPCNLFATGQPNDNSIGCALLQGESNLNLATFLLNLGYIRG